ncbi:hypothetical protein GN244_ATG09034 [Phytophthora infestans]|uniref:Uncharacterized protein n=1 Tax=Phytophthora infestans TaxID=4787 RepID=A0A833TCR9_PHYIN|nr:hypothetical protein GN244_ATG09034 [Phytophthora infestans]KAF4132540.1 hypothetical protein GN958_ATG18270 [Phytophthora infestans]
MAKMLETHAEFDSSTFVLASDSLTNLARSGFPYVHDKTEPGRGSGMSLLHNGMMNFMLGRKFVRQRQRKHTIKLIQQNYDFARGRLPENSCLQHKSKYLEILVILETFSERLQQNFYWY